ncbi:MAG: hypothetical protein EPN97_04545 [Alphaproteobacteria bacterium]|nr:MAG: hypothetical protein EPN97_04545 [Alphaproteobacteria bacterium]
MRTGIVACLAVIVVPLLLAQPALSAGPAPASNTASTPAATPAKPGAPAGIITVVDAAKVPGMTQAQREAFVREQAEKIKKMKPEERKAYFANNRKGFDAMPPEKRKALIEKLKKVGDDYIARNKAEMERIAAIEKKTPSPQQKEFMEKMPGIERAVLLKYKEMRKKHGREYTWHMIIQDAGHGGKITPVPEGQ